jgi:hypothetical protein
VDLVDMAVFPFHKSECAALAVARAAEQLVGMHALAGVGCLYVGPRVTLTQFLVGGTGALPPSTVCPP